MTAVGHRPDECRSSVEAVTLIARKAYPAKEKSCGIQVIQTMLGSQFAFIMGIVLSHVPGFGLGGAASVACPFGATAATYLPYGLFGFQRAPRRLK
jgi:hypothetical protein